METAVRFTTIGKKLHLGALIRNVAAADFGLTPEEASRLAAFIEDHVQSADMIIFDDRTRLGPFGR